jgi:DNA-binding CsgD family transcriptional regulator/tetratricopeptide (TPR) repeat protein
VIVGRARELDQVGAALGEARAGRGRLVLIAGAPGIGKSRLADAAAEHARRAGMTVARGYAVEDPGAPPLWPWLLLMRGWDDAARLPEAQTWEGDAAARFQLFTAITTVICGHATGDGLLLILEDMHWADRTSVRLLRHLAAAISGEPVAALVTYRNGAPGPLLDAAPTLMSGDRVLPLTLGGLSRQDVAAWLPRLTGSADARLAETLWQRTGGNPLLVRLAAQDLAAHGDCERLMAERPELRRLVAARASELTGQTRAVVDAASVLGERIHGPLLAEMTGWADLGPALDEAAAAGILRVGVSPGELRFEHALVRDAVYAELAPSQRAGLHRQAAQLLARVGEPTMAGTVAFHWRRAGGRDAAQQCQIWAERADTEARRALAYDDAVRYARLALTCHEQASGDGAERARLLIRLAEARFLANAVERSVSDCAAAADLAETAGRPDLLAQAALVVHGVGSSAYHTIAGICERALTLLPPGEHATRARLHAQLAVGTAERESGSRAAGLAAQALTEAERSGDPRAILEALAARHLTISIPQAVAERLELGRRAVALGRTARHPVAALWGHLWRADAALQLGNLGEASHELAEIDRVATARRSVLARWHHHRFRAVLAAQSGDFASAWAANEAARQLATQTGDISMIGLSFAFRLNMAILQADPSVLGTGWEDIIRSAPSMPLIRITIPLAHAITGHLDEARAAFEEFRHLPRSFPLGVRWFGTIMQIGIAAILLQDAEVAADLYELTAPIAHYYSGDGSGAVYSHGANARQAGELALTAGRPAEAARYLREAVTMNARIGARPHTALSRLGLARALLASGGGGLAEAAALAAGAASEFRRLDMPARAAEAARVAAEIAVLRRSVSPLSAREEEVAGLVAQALSNRQIAGRLVLSERTVETHVRSILAKLNFSTRTEIATWVLRTGSAETRTGT